MTDTLDQRHAKIVIEMQKEIDRLQAKVEHLSSIESLYAASTKALNTQLEINAKLQAELEKHRWIPVEERSPKKADYYDIVRNAGVGQAYWNGKSWRKTIGHRYIEKITHWKPIILP